MAIPRQAREREAAGWALALIAETNLQRRTDLRRVIEDAEWQQLGLRVTDARDIDDNAFRNMLEHHARTYCEPWLRSTRHVLSRNLDLLGDLLGLSAAESTILRLAVIKSLFPLIENVLGECAKLGPSCLSSALHRITGHSKRNLRAAVQPNQSQLCQSELIDIHSYSEPRTFDVRADLPGLLTSPRLDLAQVVRGVVRESPAPTLSGNDFRHLERDTQVLVPFLRARLRDATRGSNILIHGEPGVGKTDYARWVAQELGAVLLEVPIESSDGDSLDGLARVGRLAICQRVAASRGKSLVLFDEIEDAFVQESLRSGHGYSKAWMNEQLEQNPVPTLWLCNRTGRIDPAHLRRFDLVIEMRAPPRSHRHRIAANAFGGTLVPMNTIDAIAAHVDLTPAHVQRTAGVIAALPEQAPDTLAAHVHRLAAARLEVSGKRWQASATTMPAHYRTNLINADRNLDELVLRMRQGQSARLCLYGPPGTGKSAFARHLAQALDRPLLLKRASDLLSKWLGETEQNLAATFREASDEGAVLLIDEADSFLQDRQQARQSWEITQVNELLTQIESFDGILVVTTNMMSSLDGAALRRFDHKIRFDWLRQDQAWNMFADLARDIGIGASELTEDLRHELARLDRLTPGDFAVTRRRLHPFNASTPAKLLLSMLREELALKGSVEPRRAGFV